MNVLDVTCLPRAERSRTRRLHDAFHRALRAQDPSVEVIELDLARDIDDLARIDAWDVEAKFEVAYGDGKLDTTMAERWEAIARFTDQLHACDLLVLTAPMWNFCVPWQVKRWIDCVVQAGLTFEAVGGEYRGLLGGRSAVVLTSRDGRYLPPNGWMAGDFQLPYLTHLLGFVGITDRRYVVAEGMVEGRDAREATLLAAESEAADVARSWVQTHRRVHSTT